MVDGLERYLCGAIVIARDEENRIEACLESLRNQSVTMFIVVVNDGSIDGTKRIASQYADLIVDLPRHDANWTGRPELAKVFNTGFEVLREQKCDYIMISGADATYSVNYIEKMIQRMKAENVVLASGIAQGESVRASSPRGCGRMIQEEWFRNVGFIYPENYGFEAYLIFKALSQGERVKIFQDLTFRLSRKTRFSNKKMHSWGKGMKALNYWWPYAVGRAALIGLKHPLGGFNMLKGYSSNISFYDDVKEFVPSFQKKIISRRINKVLSRGEHY